MSRKETTEDIALELVILSIALGWTIGVGMLKLSWRFAKAFYNIVRSIL